MRTVTLIGGPHDGRTVSIHDATITINAPALSGWYDGRWWTPQREVQFTLHIYDAWTGIWRTGRTQPDQPAIPAKFTLFGPRIERLLARLDGK